MHIVVLNLPHNGTFTLEDYLVAAPRASQPSSISAAEPHGPRSTHLYTASPREHASLCSSPQEATPWPPRHQAHWSSS